MLHLRTTVVFFLFLCISARAQTTVDTILTMSDGARLEMLYCTPSLPPIGPGYPGIVLVHGFQGSKEDVRSMAEQYASLGYVTLGYSVRGQGGSEGEFDFFTSERILGDLKAMIDFTKALPDVNPDRIAVMGGSQGGIHAWAAAAHHLGVRTVVSIVANGRFEEDWVANNALNWTFARTIAVTTTRLKQGMKDSVNLATTTGDLSWISNLLEQYSTRERETAVTAPVFIGVSYFDGFFNPSSALRQFARIPSPKRIFLYPAGHAFPGDIPTYNFLNTSILRWLNYWLKDNASDSQIISADSAVVMFDAATNKAHIFALRDSAYWLHAPATVPANLSSRTWYFSSAGLDTTPPAVAGQKSFSYANILGSTPVTYRTPAFTSDALIAGTFGSASLTSDGTATIYQLNLQLFDVDPSNGKALPVTRGHYEYKQNTFGKQDVSSFALNTVCHTIKAGHVLEARVHGGIPLIPNTANDFGNVVLGPVQNSTNTLFYGGSQPSQLTLYFIDESISAIAANTRSAQPSEVAIYPNPCGIGSGSRTDDVTIHFANSQRSVTIAVYDNLGRRVSTMFTGTLSPGRYERSFNTSTLPGGLYHLVMNDGGQASSHRFIVVK